MPTALRWAPTTVARCLLTSVAGAAWLLASGGQLVAQTVAQSAAAPPTCTTADNARVTPRADGTHPLLGALIAIRAPSSEGGSTICTVASGIETALPALQGDIVLLGEVHDNGDHHHMRARLLAALATSKPTTLVFEHIRAEQAAALAPFNTGDLASPSRGTAADLFKALDWDASGWPDKALFAPLYEAALRSGARLAQGDPPRASVREVAKRGLAALPAEEITRLKLDRPYPPTMQNALLTELEASHCGLMPRTAFDNMAIAQRYRDAYLAAQLLAASEGGRRVILLAGNGHVRETGVPYALSLLRPDAKISTLQLLEADDGKREVRDYASAGLVLITPRAERKDPCEAMRARYGKKG